MDKYRVILLREGAERDETLFEIAGSAAQVGRLAPADLLEALQADQDDRAFEDDDTSATRPTTPHSGGTLADRVFDAAAQAGAPSGDASPGGTKRTRRTKAQIAADKEAQALGFRDAAHRTEAARLAGEADVPVSVTTSFEGAAPVPSGAPEASPATPPAAPDGQPWNPFQQG